MRLWHSRTCATLTVTVTPLISTISCDQSNWYASPGAKLSGTKASALAANRLNGFVLGEIRPTDLRDRLHYQHPRPGPRIPHGSHCGPTVPGVPIGCRSPRKRGPYSMPIHTQRKYRAMDPAISEKGLS